MRVEELTGAELDYWVAKAEGHTELELVKSGQRHFCEVVLPGEDGEEYWTEYKPSTDWERAGLIIERENIQISPPTAPVHRNGGPQSGWGESGVWSSTIWAKSPDGKRKVRFGDTALVAAMRAYVAFKFGDEVPAA